MFKINKIDCVIKPNKFESLNNGIWYYNFDIESEVITEFIMDFRETIRYKYSLVRISGEPTISKCYEAVLKAYVDEDNTSLYNTLNSPAKTKDIEELSNSIYEMIEIDFGVKELPSEIDIKKRKVIKEINAYDVSPEVNSFYLNNILVWLDKATRVGLMNSLNIEKASGKEISTLWFGNIKLDINTGAAIQMLSSLELYALECYNKTAEHKVNILNLNSIEDIDNYDYTQGYPDKLSFKI